MIFASGVSQLATSTSISNYVDVSGNIFANLAGSVQVEARTGDGRTYQLPVEYAGAGGTVPSVNQVNVILIPDLQGAGTVGLTIIVGGQRSNSVTVAIR